MPTATATPAPTPTATPTPALPYLTEEIPPCTPVAGSSIDPCEFDAVPLYADYGIEYYPDEDEPADLREVFTNDWPLFAPHLVLRGTYLPDTWRCTAGDRYRPPPYLSEEDRAYFEDSRAFKCYVDVRVNAYIVGEGPPNLTVLRMGLEYRDDWFSEPGLDRDEAIEEMRQHFETFDDDRYGGIDDILLGKEDILFLGTPRDFSAEVWQFLGSWGVEQRQDGVVVATHPAKPLWKQYRLDEYETFLSVFEVKLDAFAQTVVEVNHARVSEYGGRIGADAGLPMLLTDAHQLRPFFIEMGAYDHPDGPPRQPPPVPAP